MQESYIFHIRDNNLTLQKLVLFSNAPNRSSIMCQSHDKSIPEFTEVFCAFSAVGFLPKLKYVVLITDTMEHERKGDLIVQDTRTVPSIGLLLY